MSSRMATLPIPAQRPTRWRAWVVGSFAALIVAAAMTAYVGLRSDRVAPPSKAPAVTSQVPTAGEAGVGAARHSGLTRAHDIEPVSGVAGTASQPSIAKLARLSAVRAAQNDDVTIPAQPAPGACWRVRSPC